jgi:hypothetical protein
MELKQAISELVVQEPEWASILISLVQISQENSDGELDGSAVRNRARRPGWTLVPLRTLGILEKAGPARKKGHVGIYRLRDRKAVEDVLIERGYDVHARLPGDFSDQHRRWIQPRPLS